MKFQTKCKSTVTHVVIANQAPKVGKVRGLGVERLGYKKWASPVHEPTQDMMQISISADPCDRKGPLGSKETWFLLSCRQEEIKGGTKYGITTGALLTPSPPCDIQHSNLQDANFGSKHTANAQAEFPCDQPDVLFLFKTHGTIDTEFTCDNAISFTLNLQGVQNPRLVPSTMTV